MRIAIDIRGLANPNQGGVGEYTLELLRALFKIAPNHDFVLFSIGTEAARRHVLDNLSSIDIEEHRTHVRHIHHLAPNKSTNLKIITRDEPILDKIIRDESDSCDVFFFPNLNFISVSSAPTVVMVHDMSWKIFPQFFTTKDQAWHKTLRPQKILTEAKTVITPSESTRQDIEQELNIDGSKIQVVPHGIRHDLFNPEITPTDHGVRSKYQLSGRYLLFMATIEPRKNIHALLDAWDEYSKTDPDLQLVIVGGTGWRSNTILDRFKTTDRVHYLGYIPSVHRPALYRGAELTLFPSIYEGFGLPVLEAMACGTPVITSSTSSIPEVTANSGILVNPYNAQDMIMALSELKDSPELKAEIVERQLKIAANYTWESAAKKTLEIILQATQ